MKTRPDTQAISPRKRTPLQVVSQKSSPPVPRTNDRVIAIGNVKGGVGKTTLAVNLTICEALHGSDVLLIDGDEQGTGCAFTELREEALGAPGYTAVSLRGAEIRTQVRQLRNKYERIIIDVGGRDTASLRAALTVADVLVVPVLPASFNIWSLDPLQELIQEARQINPELRTIVVLNAADAFGKDNEEAAGIIRDEEGFAYFPHPIVRRKAFRNAAAAGLSVLEYRPVDEKAVHECGLFAAYLFGYFGDIASISHGHHNTSLAQDKVSDKRAEKFIMSASTNETDEDGPLVQTPIRFPPALLARIDRAAKRRGLNRSSWIRYAATKELDIEDL